MSWRIHARKGSRRRVRKVDLDERALDREGASRREMDVW
jgi:hypothetical protein